MSGVKSGALVSSRWDRERRRPACHVGALLAAALLGCSTPSTPSPEPKPAGASVSSTAAAQPDPTAAAEAPSPGQAAPSSSASGADPCAALAAQFDALRKAAKGACTDDTQCACFSELRLDNQTGVSDRATAAKLQGYSDDYRKRQCPTVCVQTAPQPACKARCQSGACR